METKGGILPKTRKTVMRIATKKGGYVEEKNELLRMELTELYSFVRHHFQLYFGWYTFFLTVNFVAIGWFTSVLLTGALKVSLPIIFLATFFVVQLILSYVASLEVRNYFETTHNRCNEILNLMGTYPSESHLQLKTAIPLQVYSKIFSLMCSTLFSFGIFWLALTIVSIYLVPL